MKSLWILLVCALLLAACTPGQLRDAYQQRQNAEDLAKGADAAALVTAGDSLPSYVVGGRIYTDVQVLVLRGKGVTAGAAITIRRSGGSIIQPDGTGRAEFVDYVYRFPQKGEDAFLLLRSIGEKFEVIDAMPVRSGQPTEDRPANAVYLPYVRSLQ